MTNYQVKEATLDQKAVMVRAYAEGGFLVQIEQGMTCSLSFDRKEATRLRDALDHALKVAAFNEEVLP